MPGRTVVALSAASVNWLIAMPGAISMNAAASFSSGMKPAQTVCRNPVSCGCSESRMVSARSSISAKRYHGYGLLVRRVLVIAMLVGCGSSSGTSVDAPGGGDDAVDAAEPDAAGPCPANMAEVAAATAHFCIDRYEGALEEQAGDGTWSAASPYLVVGTRTVRAVPAAGITPQGYISGAEAQAAC